MTLVCPKCRAPIDTGTAAPGTVVHCTQCGNALSVPAQAKKGTSAGVIVAIVLGVLAVPCVIGILAAIAIPNFMRYKGRAMVGEARANVRSLCMAEETYKASNGSYLAAGPQPTEVPHQKPVDFPSDPNFKKVGFEPASRVRFQYQAIPSPDGSSVRCVARGDPLGRDQVGEVVYDSSSGELRVDPALE